MSKHTPGPWKATVDDIGLVAHEDTMRKYFPDYRAEYPVYQVLAMHGSCWHFVASAGCHDRSKANVYLIAAAPDLLAVAHDGDKVDEIWLREWQRVVGPDVPLSDEAQDQLHILRTKRQAAIAKATGGTDG